MAGLIPLIVIALYFGAILAIPVFILFCTNLWMRRLREDQIWRNKTLENQQIALQLFEQHLKSQKQSVELLARAVHLVEKHTLAER